MTPEGQTNRQFLNGILSALEPADLVLLRPHLRPIELRRDFSLEEPNEAIVDVYFPESGVVSIVARTVTDQEIEVGLIGPEGMTGLPVILGSDRSPNHTYIQVDGNGHLLSADRLRMVLLQSTIQVVLLRFVQTFVVQTAHTALANGKALIDARLARWILMAQDRVKTNGIALTHHFLSVMLGVRRSGVSESLAVLEGHHLIRARRNLITVMDRPGLIEVANGFYGVPEGEYRRLFPLRGLSLDA